MGIRINKVLGYGTDTIQKDDWRLTDPRFDVELFDKGKWTFDIDGHKDAILKAFAEEYEKPEPEEMLQHVRRDWANREAKDEFQVRFEFEFGIGAMVFVLPGCKDWVRHDDIIDYYEANGSDPKFRYLRKTGYIYPYYGKMRRFQGEQRFDWEPKHLEVGHYNQMVGFWDEDLKPTKDGEDLEDLQKNWRCTLPGILLAWLYCQDWIIDKPGLVNELRPCIYEYWC